MVILWIMWTCIKKENIGLYWYRMEKDDKKWCATIRFNKKRIVIGTFTIIEEAVEAHKKKELELYSKKRVIWLF